LAQHCQHEADAGAVNGGGTGGPAKADLNAFGLDPSFFDAEDAIGRAGLAKPRPAVGEKESRFFDQITCESGQRFCLDCTVIVPDGTAPVMSEDLLETSALTARISAGRNTT